MSFNLIKYIGDSAKRIISAKDLGDLGATEEQLKSLSEGSILTFVKGAAHELEVGLADFIANHPVLSAEFHVLSDDEAKAETTVTNPVSQSESTPAPAAPVAESSPAETPTTESAAPVEPSPATTEVAADSITEAAPPASA